MYETASLLTTVAVTIKISLKRNHTSNDLWDILDINTLLRLYFTEAK